ncbi:MAG: zf-HC2 domain-containing protein [Oscillospiraceae bacterium]|jgi:hypothetical protein
MTDGKKISCEVCMDLIPLVRDGAASGESRELVERHAEGCEACRTLLREEPPAVLPPERDQELLRRVKRPLFWTGLVLMVLGAVIGTAQTFSEGSIYNAVVMPMLGVLGALILGKRWWWLPVGQLLFSGVWLTVSQLMLGDTWMWWTPFLVAGAYALLYALLVTAGALMTVLLRYAFRRRGAAAKLRRMAAGVLAGGILAGWLWLLCTYFGNPISYWLAKRDIEQYVNQNYGALSCHVEDVYYVSSLRQYEGKVASSFSRDTHFTVYWRNGVDGDSYEVEVVGRFNTRERLGQEYTVLVHAALSGVPEYEKGRTTVSIFEEQDYNDGNQKPDLDAVFDPQMPCKFALELRATSDKITPENAARLIEKAVERMEQNGYGFTHYSFYLENPSGEKNLTVDGFTAEQVQSGRLREILLEDWEKALHNSQGGLYIGVSDLAILEQDETAQLY